MYGRLILLILVFIVSSCSPESSLKYDSTYKFMEHGAEVQHSPEELYKECLQVRSEISVLKAKVDSIKGPGYERQRKQLETDIKWLSGKYKEAGCDDAIASYQSTPAGEETFHDHSTHDHSAHDAPNPGKAVSPDGPLSFDTCFKKCKDLTSRTNEECFDTCLQH